MTAATRPPFADASPAEIRAALLEEEKPQFDHEYRQALDMARESLTLEELQRTLQCWRLVAGSTQDDPEAHRRMLHAAERAAHTGETPPAAVEWCQLKQELGL